VLGDGKIKRYYMIFITVSTLVYTRKHTNTYIAKKSTKHQKNPNRMEEKAGHGTGR